MSKTTGYARNIFFSIVISLVILLALGFLSIKYLVPIYDLQTQDIYQFLIYLLPVLLGLALIEIGSIISSKHDDLVEHDEDLLPKNSYDAPLFNTINDDPSEKVATTNFTSVHNTAFSFRDSLDDKISKRIENYDNCQIMQMIEEFESGKNSNKVDSPFDKELTKSIFSYSSNDMKKAIQWLQNGSPVANENAVLLSNLNSETIDEIKKLSQREASMALDFIYRRTNYVNLENLDESNLHAISLMNNEEVTKAINWVHMGCPKPAEPNARVFENLDKDTLLRLEEYNSIQVNVGLDYIDDGAPDVQAPNAVVFPNLSETTIDRLLNYNDTQINEGLDSLGKQTIDNLNVETVYRLKSYDDEQVNAGLDLLEKETLRNINDETIDRLNYYSNDQINAGLDYVDNGQLTIVSDLPFDEDTNLAIRGFSPEEAVHAVNYIKHGDIIDDDLGDLSNNFEDFLNSELKDHQEQGYNFDLSIAIFDKENVLSEDVKDILLSKLPTYTYVYETSNNNKAIIFPYEDKVKAKSYIDSILSEEASLLDNQDIKIGYASQEYRKIDAKTLINEAYLN
ncbi:MAG: hypothetical protein OWP43_05130 [Sphaerochaetaceae bacterium]|nr:hypothetical protein [Sphaerochaetaceae bacterium]